MSTGKPPFAANHCPLITISKDAVARVRQTQLLVMLVSLKQSLKTSSAGLALASRQNILTNRTAIAQTRPAVDPRMPVAKGRSTA